MRSVLLSLLAVALPAAAQTQPLPIPGFFPAELQKYFSLTQQQIGQLNRFTAAYDQMVAEKQQRLAVLQREIQEETARLIPDVAQVGGRYIEVEAIRREADAAYDQLRHDAQALFTAEQKQKAQALDDAQRQVGTALMAQCYGLVNPVAAPPAEGVIGGTIPGGVIRAVIVSPAILLNLSRRGEINYSNGSVSSGCFFPSGPVFTPGTARQAPLSQ
jgi:hypothetical protein